MMTISYKKLFEIRVLHDFYLSGEDGSSFFGLTQAQKDQLIANLLAAGQYDVSQFLSVELHPAMKSFFPGHRMRLLPTTLGAMVALEVNVLDDAGDTVYEPFVPLEDDDELLFYLKIKNSLFSNFTNVPWRKGRFRSMGFLSNETARDIGGSWVLAQPPAAFDASANYVMGDLVTDAGTVKEVYFDLSTSNQTLLTLPSDGFVHTQDSFLLPKQFAFDFLSPVSAAVQFSLYDASNTLVKMIEKLAGDPKRLVKLDFEKTDADPPVPIPDGEYRLEVSGAISEEHDLILSDKLHVEGAFAVLHFTVRTTGGTFDLLDNQGRLHARVLADGTKVPPPVFELRFLSRKTFWRYQQTQGFATSPTPYLSVVDDKLVTPMPRSLRQGQTFFEQSPNPRQYLPGAKSTPLSFEEKNVFSEIYISPANRLTV